MKAALLALVLFGAAPPKTEKPPTPRALAAGPAVDVFEVLDISIARGWAAVRIVSHAEGSQPDDEVTGPQCKYPGMKAHPRSGVTLALWNLSERRREQSFDIYPLPWKGQACAKPAQSKAALAEAKKAIADKGLEVERRPKLVGATSRGFELPGPNGPVQVKLASKTDHDEEAMTSSTTYTLSVGDAQLFTTALTVERMGAGHGAITFEEAWVEGSKVVFLYKTTVGNMRMEETTSYAFTPVLDLASLGK